MNLATITAIHLAALSQIESGDNDFARGRAGEVSRYQVMPYVLNHAQGSTVAGKVQSIWQHRVSDYTASHQHAPSDAQLYLLWHRPARVDRPTKVEQERAKRFENVLHKLKGTK